MSSISLWQLATAKQLYHSTSQEKVEPTSHLWLNRLVSVGEKPIILVIEFLKSLQKPSSIAAATLTAAAITTLAFYPQTAFVLASPAYRICIMFFHHMLYAICQFTVLSTGVKAYLRLNDASIMKLWRQDQLKVDGLWF